MYSYVRNGFLNGDINLEGLDKAVKKGWITEEQKLELIEEKEAIDNPVSPEIPSEPMIPIEPSI